jgi:ATP-dependent Clp protease adaptor protein ClpS
MSVKEKNSPGSQLHEEKTSLRNLVLFNDDFNTFDYVIESLIEVCKHDPFQAETLTMIAHYKGKCVIKKGCFDELKGCYDGLSSRSLIVEIQ